eukprot:3801043-Alexandrium_andersonii.AAC.1
MARWRPLPSGRRCTPRLWRASGPYAERRARVAFTMLRSTSGASCTGAILFLGGTTRTWTW